MNKRTLPALAAACLGLVVLLCASLPLARADEHEQTAEQQAMMKKQMMKMQAMMKDEKQMEAMRMQMTRMMLADKIDLPHERWARRVISLGSPRTVRG